MASPFRRWRPWLLLAALAGLWTTPAHADEGHPPDGPAPPVYSFAVVPQFTPERIQRTWRPLLAAVEQRSGVHLRLEVPRNIPEFERHLYAGAYDFAYMNPYHLIVAHRLQGYRPLVADISRRMHGIVVVRRNGPIDSIEALADRRMAFPAPHAFAATLLVRAQLHRRFGITVRPWYVVNHSSVYLDVALGLAPAGGGVLATLQLQPETVQQRLRVLYRTPGAPTHPIAVSPHVPEPVVRRVTQALLDLANSAEGQALLAAVPIRQVGRVEFSRYKPLESLGLDAYAKAEAP